MTLDTYQQIVDEIQSILMSQGDPEKAVVVELHDRYVQAVAEVNRRLRRCDELLRQGHRAEAIRECETEPNLLDTVAVLDFPEMVFWSDYAEQFELQPAPRLLHDVAGDLNEAYSTEQSLEKILNQYRAHVLARSPLPTRIGVLRNIARRDPDNPIWDEDLRSFEKVRHNELQAELQTAIRARDTSALAELESELRDSTWREPPPKSLLSRAHQSHTKLRAQQAHEEMQRLQPQLTAAFSELDVEAGRRLRSRWNGLQALAQLDLDDPLLDLAAPALQWLREEDRRAEEEADYEAGVAQLERALDRGADRLKLERLAHAAARGDRELPPRVRRRYDERLHYLEVAATRKRRLIVVGIVAAVVLVGVVTGYVIHGKIVENRIATTEADLARLIDAGDLDQAQQRLEGLEEDDPRVFRSEPVQEQYARLDTALRAEATRKQNRRSLLEKATMAGVDGRKWDDASRRLQEAEKLSRGDLELTEVRELRKTILLKKHRKQKEVDDAYSNAVRGLVNRGAKVSRGDLEIEIVRIDALLKEAGKLKTSPNVSEDIKNGGDLEKLITRLEARRSLLVAQQKLNKQLEQITRRIGDRNRFAAALEAYIQQRPLSVRAQDFKAVLKGKANWKAVNEWNAVAAAWPRQDFSKLTAKEAAVYLADVGKLKKSAGGFAPVARIDPIRTWLNSVVARAGQDGKTPIDQFRAVLKDPQMQLLVLRRKNDKRYYFDAARKPKAVGGLWQVKYFTDLQLKKTEPLMGGVKRAEIANPMDGDNDFHWESPQRKFAKAAAAELDKIDKQGWEATFVNILGQLHAAEIDPILKLQLYRYVLGVAAKGSSVARAAFEPSRKLLNEARVDTTVNWIDPEETDAKTAKDKARSVLKKVKPPKTFSPGIKAALSRLVQPELGPRYVWAAWLHRNLDDSDWSCSFDGGEFNVNALRGRLFLLAADAIGTVTLRTIGRVKEGEVVLDSNSKAIWKEGKPVYLVKDPPPGSEQ